MGSEEAMPCQQPGTPPDWLVERVVTLLAEGIHRDEVFLAGHGLSTSEYELAFNSAIQRLRGRMAATHSHKPAFLAQILQRGVQEGHLSGVEQVGRGSVFRVALPDSRCVAVILKGCPDGNHSTRWERPIWASEVVLWWMCPNSTARQPGEALCKGVSRLRGKVMQEQANQLDGIVFADASCGAPARPCPKTQYGLTLGAERYPPPCVFLFPTVTTGSLPGRGQWSMGRSSAFLHALVATFGVPETLIPEYVGDVGFQMSARGVPRSKIVTRYGQGRVLLHTN